MALLLRRRRQKARRPQKNEERVASIAPERPLRRVILSLPRLQKPVPVSSGDIAASVGWPVSMGALPLFRLNNLLCATGKRDTHRGRAWVGASGRCRVTKLNIARFTFLAYYRFDSRTDPGKWRRRS
jgi:hypothetical protein